MDLDLINVIQYLEELVSSKKGFSSASLVLVHHALAFLNQVAYDEGLWRTDDLDSVM